MRMTSCAERGEVPWEIPRETPGDGIELVADSSTRKARLTTHANTFTSFFLSDPLYAVDNALA